MGLLFGEPQVHQALTRFPFPPSLIVILRDVGLSNHRLLFDNHLLIVVAGHVSAPTCGGWWLVSLLVARHQRCNFGLMHPDLLFDLSGFLVVFCRFKILRQGLDLLPGPSHVCKVFQVRLLNPGLLSGPGLVCEQLEVWLSLRGPFVRRKRSKRPFPCADMGTFLP